MWLLIGLRRDLQPSRYDGRPMEDVFAAMRRSSRGYSASNSGSMVDWELEGSCLARFRCGRGIVDGAVGSEAVSWQSWRCRCSALGTRQSCGR